MSRRSPRPRTTAVAPSGDPDTRRRICEAAIRLIVKGRGRDVSMVSIAKAARVSRQAVYLHFANRSELFLAVAEYADEQRGLHEQIEHVVAAGSGVESLERLVAVQARSNPQIWPLARLIDAARRQDPDAEAAWRNRLEQRLEGCRRLVDRLAREGGLRADLTVDVAADLLWTMTSLHSWEALVVGRGWTADQYEQRLTEALRVMLLGSGDRATAARPMR